MKYETATPLLDIDGATKLNDGKGTDLTFRHIARLVLVSNDEKEGEQKYKHYVLAQKIEQANGAVELTAEEVASIKKLVGQMMPVVVVGRMFDLLDQRTGGGDKIDKSPG
jgi:hypothetical protein